MYINSEKAKVLFYQLIIEGRALMARQVSETTRVAKILFPAALLLSYTRITFGMALVEGIRTQRPAGRHNVILTAFVSW